MEIIKLYNGNTIPFLGLGTAGLGKTEDDLLSILEIAFDIGYRLIDTAAGYNNAKTIGRFISNNNSIRNELFITSKIDDDAHTYSQVIESVHRTLDELKTDYIDLFLIHNPNSPKMRDFYSEKYKNDPNYWVELNASSWKALENCVHEGIIRNIGVSNFQKKHLEEIIKNASIMPAINQIKYCLGCYNLQQDLISYCKAKKITVQAHSSFGKGFSLNHPLIIQIANNYRCFSEDVILNFLLSQKVASLVKSSNKDHLIKNYNFNRTYLYPNYIDQIRECHIDERWGTVFDPDTGLKIK